MTHLVDEEDVHEKQGSDQFNNIGNFIDGEDAVFSL